MILPQAERPKSIEDAATVLEARERDLAEAEGALRSARVGVDEAKSVDLYARARARDRDEPDPGRQHEQRARAALEDAESNVAVERLRAARAEDALRAALSEHLDDWRQALERAQERADAASLRALAKLADCERARAELRGARAWTRKPSGAVKPGAQVATTLTRNANRDVYSVDEAIAGLRESIERSSLTAERERHQRRQRRPHSQEPGHLGLLLGWWVNAGL